MASRSESPPRIVELTFWTDGWLAMFCNGSSRGVRVDSAENWVNRSRVLFLLEALARIAHFLAD